MKRSIILVAMLVAGSAAVASQSESDAGPPVKSGSAVQAKQQGELSPSATRWFVCGAAVLCCGLVVSSIRRKRRASVPDLAVAGSVVARDSADL